MERILIVSASEKSAKNLECLISKVASPSSCTLLTSAASARRALFDEYYDYLVVNSPLLDDSAIELCLMAASNTETGVLLFVKEEFFDQTISECSENGIAVISKPIIMPVLSQSFSLLKSVRGKITKLKRENAKLQTKLDEVKLISQAKCLLIEKKGCSESEAHHLIERRAMNARISAKEAAGQIIRIYSD